MESIDRAEKFEEYKSIPSLHIYILLHQEQALAEVFIKDNHWPDSPDFITEILEILGCQVHLKDIYKQPKKLNK